MRTRFIVRVVAILVLLATVRGAHAQGSWLPFGRQGASDVAVSPSGVVWLIGREPRSIRSTLMLGEMAFVTPRGSPARVAVDLNGFPWLLNTDGTVWHWVRDGAGKEDWVQSPLKAIDMAVGANGAVWAIDLDRRVVQLRNGAWERATGSGVRIAVDPSGSPWVVGASGKISRWTGSAWSEFQQTATDITVAPDGNVFILGTTPVRGGFEVLRLNGSNWERLVGGAGLAISAGSKAVYVAQDTTTNLVLLSDHSRLRADGSSPSVATTASPVPTVASGENAERGATPAAGNETGASNNRSSGGGVSGALGAIGGLLSTGASVAATAASIAAPAILAPGAVQGAVGAAAAGAAGAAVGSAVGEIAGGAVGNVANAVSGPAASNAPSGPPEKTPASPDKPQESLDKAKSLEEPKLPNARPAPKLALPGSLRCPIIGGGDTMERGCELLGRAAMKLRAAPSSDCIAPAFADPRNGGECWTCPARSTRGTAPVDAENACLGPGATFAPATFVNGCARYKAPAGFGTPFRDSPNGSECWVCPLPLQRSWSAVASLTKGNLSACFGKAKEMLVWQLSQYPESGAYRFMPGLLSMALADPKAVDAFLNDRAGGDTAKKRVMWAAMIADPAGSAELKALLFGSLLKVANEDSANAAARDALAEFESYIRARRAHVADEALRMYGKAREVDAYYQQARDSGGIARVAAEAAGTVATDFKTYAWSAVLPDSAGTAFIAASSALAQLAGGAEGVASDAAASLNVRYLTPVTKALEVELDKLRDQGTDIIERVGIPSSVSDRARALTGADPAMIGTTLLAGAMKVSKGVMGLFNRDKVAAEYEKYVEEMRVPVRVKQILESDDPEERQTLLLYWALATSPYKAGEKIGTGAMTDAELCSADSWTAAQCSSAKAMVMAAARVAGYLN